MSICKGLVASAASQEVETSSPRNLPSKGTFRSLEISLLHAALYLKTFILKVKTLKPLKSIHQHLAKQLPEPKTSPSPFPSFNAKDAKDFSRLLCFFSSLLACFASQEAKQPKTHEFSLQLVHRKKCQESRTSSLRNSPTNVSTKKQWKPQAREIYPAVPHTQSLNKSTFRSLEISLCSSLLKNLHVYHFFQLKGGFVSPNLLHSKLYSFKMLKPCILCQDFQALEIYPSESYQKILQNLKKLPKHCVSSLSGWPSLPPLELVDIFLFCQRLNVLPMIYLNSTSDITSSVQSASAHITAVPIGYPPRTCP